MYEALIVLIETGMLIYASMANGFYRLRTLIVSNMVLITLFAPKLISMFGYTTNLGVIFYATAMLAQMMIIHMYGREAALYTIRMVLFALLSVVSLMFVSSLLPVVSGNEEFSMAMKGVLQFPPQTLFASFFAFVIAQYAIVSCLEKRCSSSIATILKYLGVAVCAQAIDSSIFFPLAFGTIMDMHDIWEMVYTGFIAKVAIMAVIGPVVVAYLRMMDVDMCPEINTRAGDTRYLISSKL